MEESLAIWKPALSFAVPFRKGNIFWGARVGAQFRDPFVDRHHNMLVMERINSMNTSKATCGSTIETPTTYEKMDAQRCISQTTPPNYIEKYQMFSTKGIPGFPFIKKTSKPWLQKTASSRLLSHRFPRSRRALAVCAARRAAWESELSPRRASRGMQGSYETSMCLGPRVAPSGEVVQWRVFFFGKSISNVLVMLFL